MRSFLEKVRYAVVGLGRISQGAVLPAFAHAKNSELVALFTGDPTKTEKAVAYQRRDRFSLRGV